MCYYAYFPTAKREKNNVQSSRPLNMKKKIAVLI